MKRIITFLLFAISGIANSQALYTPTTTNADSIVHVVNVNGAPRRTYNIDLIKSRLPINGGSLKAIDNLTRPVFGIRNALDSTVFEVRSYPTTYGNTNTVVGLNAGAVLAPGFYSTGGYASGMANTFFGVRAGLSLTTGNENTLIGTSAGAGLTGGGDPNITAALNTFVGSNAGAEMTTGSANVFVGQKAGMTNTGSKNVFVGKSVGVANTGNNNTFVNGGRGSTSNAGSSNVVIGNTAGDNQTGSFNVLIGEGAGLNVTSNDNVVIGRGSGGVFTTGVQNVFVGSFAGSNTSNGYSNTFMGYRAGNQGTGGSENTLIGSSAGYNLAGSSSVMIGNQAGYNTTSGNANIFIGDYAGYANTTGSNQFVAGDNNGRIDNVYFGRGITSASASAYTINGTGGSGTNIVGGDIQIAGGKGTGNAAGGAISFMTSDVGSSGTTLQSITTKATISASGNMGIGAASPATKLHVAGAITYDTTTEPADPASGKCVTWFDGTNFKVKKNVGGTVTATVIF